MNGYVVDASIAVEYLLRTPAGTEFARISRGKRLVAPELIDAEVMSSIRRAVLRGELTELRATRVLESLINWPIERIPHAVLVMRAWDHRNNVTAYDALYIAAAQMHGMELITSDGRLSRAPVGDIAVVNLR